MSILKIHQYGDSVLRQPSTKISAKELQSRDFAELVENMIETMYEFSGVGLAATQVGVNKQLIIIDTDYVDQHDKLQPMILINPKILEASGNMDSDEGCLSFRGDSADIGVKLTVSRFNKIKIAFLDMNGKKQVMKAYNNLLCRCLQHEIDHLNGILFIDHYTNIQSVNCELAKSGFPDIS